MTRGQFPNIKNIAFSDAQVNALESIKADIGYGTFTMIVRDAVNFYIEQGVYKERLDYYGEIKDAEQK